jgi:phenylalanyl-tRNA synthetase alpha chain
MIEKIEELLVEVNSFNATSKEDIENFRIKYNGKKGILNDFFENSKKFLTTRKKISDRRSIL